MKAIQSLTAAALIAVLGFTSASCNGNSGKSDTHEHMEDQAAVYYCPMECEGDKTYDKAGQCPVCGMDLVVKE